MNRTILHAPVISPKQIVDVGCGTGVVTCYLGERFPGAHVWDIDTSPLSTIHQKPNSVSSVQGDFQTLALTDGRLAQAFTDLVFSRVLICGIIDYERYIETAVSMHEPRGYLEVQETERCWHVGGEEVGRDWEWRKACYDAPQSERYRCGLCWESKRLDA